MHQCSLKNSKAAQPPSYFAQNSFDVVEGIYIIDKMTFVVGRNYFIVLEKHLLMGPVHLFDLNST